MTERSNLILPFEFLCPLPSGLHARPASQLAEVANQFVAECTITNLRNGAVANGKSVLSIIAADIRHNDRCVLVLNGDDDQEAHAALRTFIEQTLPKSEVAVADIPILKRVEIPRPLAAANVTCIPGMPISRGVGQGNVVVLKRLPLPGKVSSSSPHDPRRELVIIEEAVAAVRHRIREKLTYAVTPVGAAVLQADLAMARDTFLIEKLAEQVRQGKSAAEAIVETNAFFTDLLAHSENEYVRQRSADIEEICGQLLEEACGTSLTTIVKLVEPSVLVAETLAPQQLLELDRYLVKALILEHSGTTSHAAILARSLGIPAVVGVRNARLVLTPGREVVVDANRGFVVPQVNAAVRRFYEREQKTLAWRNQIRSPHLAKLATTRDGQRIELAANVSSGEEATLAFENGAEGIGLFRTEMIFLGRENAPSEEEQFAIYSEAVRSAAGRPVIIRTFDVGGDKKIPYLNLRREDNPFLGYRGARLYAEHQALLQSQLRAILRASILGHVQIMVPMISTLNEIKQFKRALSSARGQLMEKGVQFTSDVKIGIMVEVPSIAFMLDRLCGEVDFFSIGTNDLSQYFFAADRSNSNVTSLFTVRHPSFLRFLDQIVKQIHAAGKWVGMCGEMAANVRNLPLLLGLGLDELSLPSAEVRNFKLAIAGSQFQQCVDTFNRALALSTEQEVDSLLASRMFQTSTRPLLSNELVLLGSLSRTKEEVIQEMVDAFYVSGRTDDRQLLENALWAREAMGSTSLGYGFAIPHCKTDAVSADSICILRLKEQIHWDSDHGEPVGVVVLLALRESNAVDTHMQVFSSLARKLISDEFRRDLLKIETVDGITNYLGHELGIPPDGFIKGR
jgi:multiphosphoryl transfer protein